MKTPFVGRTREFDLLDDLWHSNRAELLILYGRRRVGKSRLLFRWLEQTKPPHIYWAATLKPALKQLEAFSRLAAGFDGRSVPSQFTYDEWEQAFEEIGRLAQHGRVCVVLDEFTYLMQNTPGIASVLQNAWDQDLSGKNIFLILTGSHLGMMKRDVLDSQAPLYGRASNTMHLEPLEFGHTQAFFPKYAADDRVAVYSCVGGIPAYLELFRPNQNVSNNVKRLFLGTFNPMHNEPLTLIHDFVHNPSVFVGFLEEIAGGAHTQAQIGSATGTTQSHVSQYLALLQETGFIRRRYPVTVGRKSRNGRYHIADPYLRFYFRFISPMLEDLSKGLSDETLSEIKRHCQDFIGMNTWEELCREWVRHARANKLLPYSPRSVGSAWNQKAQIDVVGINTREKSLILGECKWTRKPEGRNTLVDLVERKADELVPPVKKRKWQVYFLGFSRKGWTPAAHEYANSLSQKSMERKNWYSTGMRLVTLEELDADFAKWAR